MYPQFTRVDNDGKLFLVVPYERLWKVGDRNYSINNDRFFICKKEHRTIEAKVIYDYAGEAIDGKTPAELGATNVGFLTDHWVPES